MPERRVCGICMLRNAIDLAPFLCGHYLRTGLDKIIFVDDGSSDGTFEFLEAISRRSSRVGIEKTARDVYSQPQVMTEASNAAIKAGFRIIFPFDADEFWNIDAESIRSASVTPGLFVGRWVQFVQQRTQRRNELRGLLNVRYRAPGFSDTSAETVFSYKRAFVNLIMPKIAFVAESPIELRKGQHSLASGPTDILARDLEIFHLPLRSADEVASRALRAERQLAAAKPGESWQSRFFKAAAAEDRLADVWKANSASLDGFLDLPTSRMMLIPDDRLGRLLRRAYRYMVLSFPAQMLAHSRRPAP